MLHGPVLFLLHILCTLREICRCLICNIISPKYRSMATRKAKKVIEFPKQEMFPFMKKYFDPPLPFLKYCRPLYSYLVVSCQEVMLNFCAEFQLHIFCIYGVVIDWIWRKLHAAPRGGWKFFLFHNLDLKKEKKNMERINFSISSYTYISYLSDKGKNNMFI